MQAGRRLATWCARAVRYSAIQPREIPWCLVNMYGCIQLQQRQEFKHLDISGMSCVGINPEQGGSGLALGVLRCVSRHVESPGSTDSRVLHLFTTFPDYVLDGWTLESWPGIGAVKGEEQMGLLVLWVEWSPKDLHSVHGALAG